MAKSAGLSGLRANEQAAAERSAGQPVASVGLGIPKASVELFDPAAAPNFYAAPALFLTHGARLGSTVKALRWSTQVNRRERIISESHVALARIVIAGTRRPTDTSMLARTSTDLGHDARSHSGLSAT